GHAERLRDLRAMAPPLSAGHDAQHRARLRCRGARPGRRASRAARASTLRLAALAGSRGALLFMDQPRGYRSASAARPPRHRMLARVLIAAAWCAVASAAGAQTLRNEAAPTPQPVLTISANAQATVPNDRMQAALRAEAEAPDAAQAASEVNA